MTFHLTLCETFSLFLIDVKIIHWDSSCVILTKDTRRMLREELAANGTNSKPETPLPSLGQYCTALVQAVSGSRGTFVLTEWCSGFAAVGPQFLQLRKPLMVDPLDFDGFCLSLASSPSSRRGLCRGRRSSARQHGHRSCNPSFRTDGSGRELP